MFHFFDRYFTNTAIRVFDFTRIARSSMDAGVARFECGLSSLHAGLAGFKNESKAVNGKISIFDMNNR